MFEGIGKKTPGDACNEGDETKKKNDHLNLLPINLSLFLAIPGLKYGKIRCLWRTYALHPGMHQYFAKLIPHCIAMPFIYLQPQPVECSNDIFDTYEI